MFSLVFCFLSGKMVESKKALPKEPRLSYYSSYTNPYYGGHGQLSPPGARNYYGPTGYPGGGGYMNGNRYYQHHPHFQVCNLDSSKICPS